jgi:hypothetical protein
MRTIVSWPTFEVRRAESQPILYILACCCASVEEKVISKTVVSKQKKTDFDFIVTAPVFD